jgi:hypothetical protein
VLKYNSGLDLWENVASSDLTGSFVQETTFNTYTQSQEVLNATFATTGSNTFTGDQTFNNITVNGTGSFAYIESITGSAKIIGDAFIVLNNNTPAERYAGVAVYDSGSANTTASFQFDGQTNDWFYEYSNDGGVTTDHGVAMFGPEYSTKGVPTYPTTNTLLKGNGHHVEDSNITDDGATIILGSNTEVNGVMFANSLQSEPANADTPSLFVTDAIQQRIIVNSQNGAIADGWNIKLNGNIDVPSGNISLSGAGQIINNPNGAVEAGEVATPNLLVDTIQPNNAAAILINSNVNVSGSIVLSPNKSIEATQVQATEAVLTSIIESTTGQLEIAGAQVTITEGLKVNGNFTASLQEGYVWVGNNTGTTTTVSTGSFGGGGGGPATVTNLTVTSNTASIDLSLGTKFYLDLPVGSTELTIDNRVDGESFSLLVSQSVAGTGSVTFGDDTIKFAGGIPYQATNRTSAEDVISFEIFNRDNGAGSKYVYVSSVKNLI